MHARLLAAVVSVACVLPACGFVPPAAPTPDDAPRVAINHGDPRKTDLPAATATATATATTATDPAQTTAPVAVAPIPIPAAPPEPPAVAASSASPAPEPEATPPSIEPIRIASTTLTTADALPTLPATADRAPQTDPSPPPEAPTAVAMPEAAPAPEPFIPKPVWQIQPEDGTVRQALVRWAAKAGWTFGPDQWELNFDLPIQAPAQFEADSFEDATRALSEAIAMTESPVRPCFYANHVLRIIPFTRSCNRAAAATPSP